VKILAKEADQKEVEVEVEVEPMVEGSDYDLQHKPSF
jgi:hypothetical protein